MPRLWCKLVHRRCQRARAQPVRQLDVARQHLDVAHPALRIRLHRPLVLVQKRNRVDQRQVLLVVATHPRCMARKLQTRRQLVHHRHGPQQPLRVLVHRHDVATLMLQAPAHKRARRALQVLNRTRLLGPFIHRQHQAAIQKLLVDVDARRRHHHHHRPRHLVLLRHQPPRLRVLARARNRQLPRALQNLQRIGRVRV